MITDYGTLKTEIADFLLRDDLTAVIPTFVSFAHEKLNRDMRTRQMVQRATASLTTEYTALPGDFLQMRDIRLNSNPVRSLEYISSEGQNQEREFYGNTSGEPRYYTIIGETIQVFPSPDTTYTIEMAYYEKIPALVNPTDTNWLLTKAPDIYLYGSLVHSAPYLKDDERIVIFQTLFRDIFNSLKTEDEKSRFGGTTPRMRHRSFG
jgi:hypothetical protein